MCVSLLCESSETTRVQGWGLVRLVSLVVRFASLVVRSVSLVVRLVSLVRQNSANGCALVYFCRFSESSVTTRFKGWNLYMLDLRRCGCTAEGVWGLVFRLRLSFSLVCASVVCASLVGASPPVTLVTARFKG